MAKRSEDAATTQTAVLKQEETLQALLRRYEPTIKAALPAHVTPERMLSIARTAIAVNPGLRRCSPLSVIAGVVLASRLGLECDGLLGEAYLIPRWNSNTQREEASFQLGYKGMHKLSIQHPDVEHVETRLIHEKDKFSLVYEPAPKFSHEPAMSDRGPVIGAYTYIRYKTGRVEVFEPMTVSEALDIRDRFGPRNKAGDLVGPWVTDTNEMIRKTAFRRNWKWMPKAVEMREAMRAETRLDMGESPETVVLDLPAEDTASADAAAATDAKTEDLKRRLDARGKGQDHPVKPPQPGGTMPGEATGGGAAGPAVSGSSADGAEGEGPGQGARPSPAAATAPSPKTIREVKELPDTMEVEDEKLFCKGDFWVRNADNTAWRKVPPKPLPEPTQATAAEEKPAPAQPPKQAGTFDFGGKRT